MGVFVTDAPQRLRGVRIKKAAFLMREGPGGGAASLGDSLAERLKIAALFILLLLGEAQTTGPSTLYSA